MVELRVDAIMLDFVKGVARKDCSWRGMLRRPDPEKGMRCQMHLSFQPDRSKAYKTFKLLQNKFRFIIGKITVLI